MIIYFKQGNYHHQYTGSTCEWDISSRPHPHLLLDTFSIDS
uniref:Uncharacterized protein n=1 Tax=Arundo donax TaxID=35708 RepID=A0A0A9BL87_ARUDO